MEVIIIEIDYIKRQKNDHRIDKKTDIYYNILKRKDIVKFTYDDYLKIIKQRRKYNKNILREDQEKYEVLKNEKIMHEHDKTYRQILSNPKQAAYIINKALKTEIKQNEIEKYNSRYITKDWKDREVDIIYKLKERNIFFLIEHQSEIDYSMPYRLEEYKLEIIKSAIDIKKLKRKDYEVPIVIPIVIYTGKRKWKVKLTLNEMKEERLKEVDLQKYNLIDINKEENKNLMKSDKLIDKIFLIEKIKKEEELVEILKKVVQEIKEEEDKEILKSMMTVIMQGKIKTEDQEKLIGMLEKEENGMIAVVEVLREENKRREEKGRREGIKSVASNMLNKGMKIDEIKDITGLSEKEIMKLKLNNI